MTVEIWINDKFCKIGRKTFCCNCMNGDHDSCLGFYEDEELDREFTHCNRLHLI